jgi:hypothetical protein
MPISKRQAMILASLLACVLGLVLLLFVRIVPPTFGRVVDAITGRPVGNIEVILQVSSIVDRSLDIQVAHRTSTTQSGWFVLPGTFRWDIPLVRLFQHSWLTLNAERSGYVVGEEGAAAFEIQFDPMFNTRNEPVGNTQYFPLDVTFRKDDCDRVWDAACLYRKFWLGFSIPLVPVLNDVEHCNTIADSSLRERCRQLNTYRAAFVHVDTYEEVQRGKNFCNQLESVQLSKTCLDQLKTYISNPTLNRPIKPKVNEPIPDGMFPDTLAGLPVVQNKHCTPRDAFSGQVMCVSGYGTETKQLVAISIGEFPGSSQLLKPTDWKPQYTDHAQARVRAEMRPGGQILRYQGPMYNSFFWYSGDKHVELFFYKPIPQQEQFVSYYLKKFPSTLRNQ